MKILLQHTTTSLYLRDPDTWTASPTEAYNFRHSQRLLHFVDEHHLDSVQIAVRFPDCDHDEIFPINWQQTQPQMAV